ncbi:DUF222 domain-containing protein [Homoserinimonas sp. A520]
MSSSVAIFEDEVDQLIDTLVTSLETVLPTGALRPVSDDTLLVTTGHLERLGRVVDARRVEAAGELQHRSRPTLGSASLAVRKGCRDAVELLRRVTLTSTGTVRRRVKLGAETRVQVALSGDLFPPRFPHIATALHDGTLGVDAASAIVTELSPTLVRADVAEVQRAEAELVAAATGTGPDSPVPCTAEEIRGQASVWRVFLDQDGTLPTEEKAMGRRAFSPGSYNSADGLVHGRYALMPEVHGRLGKVFDACLTPKTAPAFLPEGHQPVEEGASTGGITTGDVSTEPAPGPVDTRTPDQQRHDVFAAMIDGFARSGQAPTIGGASPTVLVQVTADDPALRARRRLRLPRRTRRSNRAPLPAGRPPDDLHRRQPTGHPRPERRHHRPRLRTTLLHPEPTPRHNPARWRLHHPRLHHPRRRHRNSPRHPRQRKRTHPHR